MRSCLHIVCEKMYTCMYDCMHVGQIVMQAIYHGKDTKANLGFSQVASLANLSKHSFDACGSLPTSMYASPSSSQRAGLVLF